MSISYYETDTYKVVCIPIEQASSEDHDEFGNTLLLEQPLNYNIENKETGCVEVRSPFLPASIQICIDLQTKLDAIRSRNEKSVPKLVS